MPNKITDTGIINSVYNGRSIIVHRSSSDPLVRASDGTLYAAARTGRNSKTVNVYRSSDNGFSWANVYSGSFASSNIAQVGNTGLNHNGSHLFLCLYEDIDTLVLLHSLYDTNSLQYKVERWVFANASTGATLTDTSDSMTIDQDLEAISVTYNDSRIFMLSSNFSDLYMDVFEPTGAGTATNYHTTGGAYYPVFDAKATDNGYVDILAVADATTIYRLQHRRFNLAAGTFSTAVNVYNTSGLVDIGDVNIARDGYGNLLAAWGEENSGGTSVDVKYSISTDDGATWSAAATVPFTVGHTAFRDDPTGQLSARIDTVGGISGFMISYARVVNSTDKIFVRLLTTTDGSAYTLEDEKQIATQTTTSTEDVPGAVFFKPPSTKLLDLSIPGNVRIGYHIGQGNSTTQTDTWPIRVGQELLSESAYPSVLQIDEDDYDMDSAGAQQILVTINVLGAPSNNLDYYALGVTGTTTNRYLSAFSKVGTDMLLLRYEPISGSYMSDRSAYEDPSEYVTKVVLAPMTYEAALADQGSVNFTTFIERDARKLYLPPDLHLERTFLLNKGNFLKRTVWSIWFDGNEYELSQVVPFFLKNQICYYTANAYVIGASNDPFSKRILPSET